MLVPSVITVTASQMCAPHFEFAYAKVNVQPLCCRTYSPWMVFCKAVAIWPMLRCLHVPYHGDAEHQRGDEIDGGRCLTLLQLVKCVEEVGPAHDPKQQAERLRMSENKTNETIEKQRGGRNYRTGEKSSAVHFLVGKTGSWLFSFYLSIVWRFEGSLPLLHLFCFTDQRCMWIKTKHTF